MAPTCRMPDPVTRRRLAALDDLHNALSGARCAAQLAGLEAGDFLVHELLLRVIDQIDRAAVMARRLV